MVWFRGREGSDKGKMIVTIKTDMCKHILGKKAFMEKGTVIQNKE